ncbi:MAG: folylpolyglutamate synthase/dihydrofolate synthase family protein [Rickettsiaceae bacterium]
MVQIPSWPPVPIWRIPSKLDLTDTVSLLKKLGNPQNKLPPTIHVAGTNGKGSSVAMLKNIFQCAGYKVHSYTSPHLLEFNERICLNNHPISDAHLETVLAEVKQVSEELNIQPTFFEGTTVAAFKAFADMPADILLLETGLGGRLDCTNVITSPIATIITPISMDHIEILGDTLLEIANEKAGIIKQNVPCIIGPQLPAIYELLLAKCAEKNAPAFCYEYDFCVEKQDNGFTYLSQKFNLNLPMPNLLGDHQVTNAATVVAAIMLINEHYKITGPVIAQGLTSINWPGRIQQMPEYKIQELTGKDNITIFIDGAHNDSGAMSLANWATNREGAIYLILGMTRNRNAATFCSYFKNIIHKGFTVPVESEPLSCNASVLASNASKSGIVFDHSHSLVQAIKDITIEINDKPATIIITGSLFLVADCLKL